MNEHLSKLVGPEVLYRVLARYQKKELSVAAGAEEVIYTIQSDFQD